MRLSLLAEEMPSPGGGQANVAQPMSVADVDEAMKQLEDYYSSRKQTLTALRSQYSKQGQLAQKSPQGEMPQQAGQQDNQVPGTVPKPSSPSPGF